MMPMYTQVQHSYTNDMANDFMAQMGGSDDDEGPEYNNDYTLSKPSTSQVSTFANKKNDQFRIFTPTNPTGGKQLQVFYTPEQLYLMYQGTRSNNEGIKHGRFDVNSGARWNFSFMVKTSTSPVPLNQQYVY